MNSILLETLECYNKADGRMHYVLNLDVTTKDGEIMILHRPITSKYATDYTLISLEEYNKNFTQVIPFAK